MTNHARRYGGGDVPARLVMDELEAAIAEDGIETILLRAGVQLSGARRQQLYNGGTIPFELAEQLLTFGLGDPTAISRILGDEVRMACDDCGVLIEPGQLRSLELWRVVPDAPAGKRARAGGRRKRRYDLCRRCAGEALRQRPLTTTRYKRNGVYHPLRTRDRVEPGKPGRPRLLTDAELRSAHSIYESGGLSMRDLATSLVQARGRGTISGYSYAITVGWDRLGLKKRPKGEAQALAHHRRGRIPKRQPICVATKRNGQPCTAPAKRGHTRCISHIVFG